MDPNQINELNLNGTVLAIVLHIWFVWTERRERETESICVQCQEHFVLLFTYVAAAQRSECTSVYTGFVSAASSARICVYSVGNVYILNWPFSCLRSAAFTYSNAVC